MFPSYTFDMGASTTPLEQAPSNHLQAAMQALLAGSTDINQDLVNALNLAQDSFTPSLVDDWLVGELQQTGLLPTNNSLGNPHHHQHQQHQNSNSKQPQDVANVLHLFPHSPPLTASPSSSPYGQSPSTELYPGNQNGAQSMTPNHGASGLSPERNTNGDGNNSKQTGDTFVPLFPEIQAHSPPKPVQITRPRYAPVAPRPIQPIMPKTGAWSCAKIAPRPSSYVEPVKRCLEDNQDDIALKRQKNTDAARRSRLKKVKKMEALEERVSELEGEKSGLVTRIAVLESEKAGLEAKDRGLEERIRVLEKQLAEAHKALTKQ